ncbi:MULTISPECIES: AGE family epimerase/isomerase [unclassified Microbulbifer]|uniref:AGE family epimerase/isomerase n=1 Tax=unclassified Microbulbifer TaxID=2619833 RepID=UPI0027E417FF|nr:MULTISPECIES: AGE family epimerase/isomerase [unclassified Microbulbifer]
MVFFKDRISTIEDTGTAGLGRRAELARSWMFEASFPLWSENGVADEGGFWESLDLQGRPLENPVSRVRVQARQVFVFALAAVMGWQPKRSLELVRIGLRNLHQACRREDGLYGRTVDLNSRELSDDRADLYDSAFVLLAHAWALRAGAGAEALTGGMALSMAIDQRLRCLNNRGRYFERLPATDRVEQNPHMHLLEASLAWHEAARDQRSLQRSQELVALMESRFVDRELSGLREVFSEDWGPHEDDRFEAGHQYEWVWLLHEHGRICSERVSSVAPLLYRKGRELTLPNGRIYLSHELNGDVREIVHRCWGLTEALKAELALVRAGDTDRIATANAVFDRLWTDHIQGAISGGWLDRLDSSGKPVSTDMPASTGYHLHLAFSELIDVVRILSR